MKFALILYDMGRVRTGSVGYHYRDWVGVFYPPSSTLRRHLQIYAENFDVCELTQFTHQMPDRDWIAGLAKQVKTDLKFFIRIHQSMTHHADTGMALSIAKHFRKALEPLIEGGKVAGLVACFPYAFRESSGTVEYVERLQEALGFENGLLHLDMKHPSWTTDERFAWMAKKKLGFVCVDEPQLQSNRKTMVVATTDQILVRLHGRNAEGWWSGNPTTRFDYCYTVEEISALMRRYEPLARSAKEVSFLFQNHWQAQSVKNALQWKIIAESTNWAAPPKPVAAIEPSIATPGTWSFGYADLSSTEEDQHSRPPTSLPMAELKARVSKALADVPEQKQGIPQIALTLRPRE